MWQTTMNEPETKKQKKGSITEDDVNTMTQRYSLDTILALLKEVAQYPEVNINWKVVTENIALAIRIQEKLTGKKNSMQNISNPREFQMLWHHLAYREPLIDQRILEQETQSLDDVDSDLEYEVEALPPESSEVVMEAAKCVQVLVGGKCIKPEVNNKKKNNKKKEKEKEKEEVDVGEASASGVAAISEAQLALETNRAVVVPLGKDRGKGVGGSKRKVRDGNSQCVVGRKDVAENGGEDHVLKQAVEDPVPMDVTRNLFNQIWR